MGEFLNKAEKECLDNLYKEKEVKLFEWFGSNIFKNIERAFENKEINIIEYVKEIKKEYFKNDYKFNFNNNI